MKVRRRIMSEPTFRLTVRQLQRLLTRFGRELDNHGKQMSDADLDKLATDFVHNLSPTCKVTADSPNRMLNSNVVIKI